MFCEILGVVKLRFVCRAVGCIFGELLNNSPLFPVSMLQILVDMSNTHSKELFGSTEALASFPDLPTIQFLTTYSQRRSQDEQVMWAQHGHTQCVRNMHLLGDLGHAPAMKIIHSEIASEAVFGHKYNSFSLTCMLASYPNETCDRAC